MRTIDELEISPTPWKDNVWQSSDDRGHDIKDGHNHLIAEMFLMSGKERMANARLIAAAPELYESLAAVVSWYERNKPLPYEENGIQMIMYYAKKSLAKASGEEVVK